LKPFLTPTPSSDESGEWEDVEHKFAVTDERTASLLVTLMRSNEDFLEECKLLAIVAFRNACLKKESKVVRKLFNFKQVQVAEKTGASILEQWRHNAKAMLERLAPERKKTNDWYSEACAYKLVIAHITFIKSCFVIKNKKSLDWLETKYGLDWNQPGYLNDVSD
jgi:hypothetical protein